MILLEEVKCWRRESCDVFLFEISSEKGIFLCEPSDLILGIINLFEGEKCSVMSEYGFGLPGQCLIKWLEKITLGFDCFLVFF